MTHASLHPFDQAIHLTGSADRFHGHTSPAYANMRGPFGGVTAAVLLNAVLSHPARQGEPVSLTVNFAAPVADGPFELHTQLIRTNRSTQHWFVMQQQGDVATSTATVVLAIRRDSWGSTELDMPDMPPRDACQRPELGFLPPWTQRYDLRFKGALRFDAQASADATSESQLWIEDNPPRPLDFLSLTACCDVFFPRIMVRRRQFTPAGTVSLTIYFHTNGETLAALGKTELLGRAYANRFNQMYCDQSAEIWTPSGELLATSHQIVYFKSS